MEKRTQRRIMNNPMILHYFIDKNKIKVFYSNNKAFTYPYSVEKELEITKRLKLQAKALAIEFKKVQRISRLYNTGIVTSMTLLLANLAACAFSKKEMATVDLVFNGGMAAWLLGLGFLKEENSKDYHEVRKLQVYMENYKKLSDALIASNYATFGNDITKEEANNITKEDITSCSYEYLFEEAGLILKRA